MRLSPAILFAAVALGASAPAGSQPGPALVTAIEAGVVGERFDGYMSHAGTASPEVRRQVNAINIKRRSLYTALAARRRVTVQAVGIAAGCELLAKVGVGQAYMLSDGEWRRRQAGQAAPVPEYCTS
ncbi:MAG TPA: YdbL family protein [Sphingomicrobium sp.]|nr:YdbL family protein [Sphingomicrobium sp.]